MKVNSIRISNYKGFLDSGEIAFSPDWNVVVGQNNSGKTALIEAFRLHDRPARPHRDDSFPRNHPYPEYSRCQFRLSVSQDLIDREILSSRGVFNFPVPEAVSSEILARTYVKTSLRSTFGDMNVTLFNAGREPTAEYPSHGDFEKSASPRYVQLIVSEDSVISSVNGPFGGPEDGFVRLLANLHNRLVYVFEAKRFALGFCQYSATPFLSPNANNLPAVLMQLSANPVRMDEFNDNVSAVFPTIKRVVAVPHNGGFEVRIWPVDPATQRDDLAIPLDECGTGVGQVLAILYVAMTNEPGVIAIDEPNSFLHPGAAKKLIQILKRYPKHQYIISTHSSDVISAAQPAVLHLARFDGRQSHVETFSEGEVEAKRMMLEEVGASLSDVFSAERVIWVEGPTERACFDLIVNTQLGGPFIGLAFVALRNTGDFDGREADARAVLDIYDALTKGGSILPIAVGFSFDGEGKSETEIADLQRRCGGRARVLARRMTENYLLHPAAIAAVLVRLGEEDVTSEFIDGLLKKHAPSYLPNGLVAAYGTDKFVASVDGAKLLSAVFQEATEERHRYNKVRDAVELLREILLRDKNVVDELIEFVRQLVGGDFEVEGHHPT